MSSLFKFNKKGEANDANIPATMLYYMVAGFIIVFLMFGFGAVLLGWQQGVSSFPDEMKAEVMVMRFIQNSDCFAYSDSVTGVVYPGTIDLEKFTENRMNQCYYTGEGGKEYFQFELYLKELDKRIETDNKYDNLVDQTIQKQILVYKEGKFVPETLFIYVQERI